MDIEGQLADKKQERQSRKSTGSHAEAQGTQRIYDPRRLVTSPHVRGLVDRWKERVVMPPRTLRLCVRPIFLRLDNLSTQQGRSVKRPRLCTRRRVSKCGHFFGFYF